MPLPTRHGLGLELRLQTVELEKSLRPPPPFQTWAGAYGVAVGCPKMFRTRVSLQPRLGRQGIRGEGGTSPRKAARWWTAREHSGDRRGDSDWSYQRPGRKPLTNQAWVASAMKWEAKYGEGRRWASFVMSSACYIDALHS